MSLPIAREIVDAAEHLPNGATLVFHQVGWQECERLLEDLVLMFCEVFRLRLE